MPLLTAYDHVPSLLLRLAAPGIPPALSLAAMIAGPMQTFALAAGSVVFTPIVGAMMCFHFARQFSAREHGAKRAGLFVAWVLVSALAGLALTAATLAFTPLTPKPGWLEAK